LALTVKFNEQLNLILDVVGGDYFERNIEALAYRGRLVQLATSKGRKVNLALSKMMSKRLTLTGSTLRGRSVSEKAKIARALEINIWPLLNKGKIKPIIFKVFPIEEAADAHALMEAGELFSACGTSVRNDDNSYFLEHALYETAADINYHIDIVI
jgi:NADPH2:quinone reductase